MKGNERIASMLAAPGTPHLRSTLASVLFLAWPAIIEQIMLTLVQYVDTAMVGSLGSNATAAVGVTSSTTWLFNGFFNAAAIGFSVQVAQHLGAGRQEDAKRVTWQSLRFVGIFGVLMGAIAFVLSFFLPAMLGADPSIRGTPPCISASWPALCPLRCAPICSAPLSAARGIPARPWC